MQDKRLLREMKRQIKRDGNRSRRRYLNRRLAENPEDAHFDEYTFDHNSSAGLNGFDNDNTRASDK